MITKKDLLNFLYYHEREFHEDGDLIFVNEVEGAETGTAFKFDSKDNLVDFYTFDMR